APPPVPAASRRPRRKARQQFSLLIVRGDGSRVVRFNFPRPAAMAAFASIAVAVSVFGVLFGDWVQLRNLTVEARTFKQQMADRLSARDELERLADNVKEQGDSLRALDRLMTRAGKALAALPSRWPIRGGVNSEFGMRPSPWSSGTEFHSGLDIRAQHGTPIRAPAGGVVTIAGTYQEYGITVILDHGQDVKSVYGHLSKTNVKPGDRVDRGAVVGWSGNTGRSTGAHLHYEILVKGQAVNPRAYLWD